MVKDLLEEYVYILKSTWLSITHLN